MNDIMGDGVKRKTNWEYEIKKTKQIAQRNVVDLTTIKAQAS